MRSIPLCAMCILVMAVSGCVTTPAMNCGQETQPLKAKIGSLQDQIEQLKNENAQLRVQLQAAQAARQQVRMPTAGEIQAALKNAGYYKGPIDNQIGPATKDAIQRFQKAKGMNPDGVVGSRTWQLLSEYLKK